MGDWDSDVDLLVVGSGAGGLSAAITAADAGLRVLVIESTAKWGGTTTLSGGGLWMPNNPLMPRHADSTGEALSYLDATVGEAGPAASPERRRAFVEAVPDVVGLLRQLGVPWVSVKHAPDYYPDRPGGKVGRAIETAPFDGRSLGLWWTKSRADETVPIPLRTDDAALVMRSWSTPSGFVGGARLAARTLSGIAGGKRLVGLGAALVGHLMTIVRRQGTRVLLSTPLTGLVVEDGRVAGVSVTNPDGTTSRIRAGAGVVLAAGGFARNRAWRERYHGVAGYSSAADGDQGSAIRIAQTIGAQLSLMDEAWWGSAVPSGDPEGKAQCVHGERSLPFSIVVDHVGDRYTNESANQMDFGHAMFERNRTVPAIPSWLILDARHRRRYLFGALLAGTSRRRASGIVHKAQTLEELARQLHMDATRLRATVERFNSFARDGVDLDFGRGATAADNYYGDPRVTPNPNLGPLEQGPFTAVQLVPGDLGTKGGLVTDADACVLDAHGEPVEGLYAAGNTAASVMGRSEPGPGSTVSPAVVFGYRAARHAAGHRRPVAALTVAGS